MLNELKDLSLELKKKIKDYSTFDLVMIGEIFAKIMNYYENEEYSYQQTHYFCIDNAVGGGMLFVMHPAFIIKDCVQKRFYSFKENDLDTLIQEGNGVIFYRLKNNIIAISKQELEKLMTEFIGETSKKIIY